MSEQKIEDMVQQAETLYLRWKDQLEQSDHGKFIAIEPVSGEYFLGTTFSDAMNAANTAHPNHLCHTRRIGHNAAVFLGGGRTLKERGLQLTNTVLDR